MHSCATYEDPHLWEQETSIWVDMVSKGQSQYAISWMTCTYSP